MHLIQQLRTRARAGLQSLTHAISALTGQGLATSAPHGQHGASGARRRAIGMMLLAVAALLVSGMAAAFTAPAAGDFGYDVYDIVVNQILNGPIGFIGGLFLIVFGATQIMKNWVMTILCIIAGTVLIRAEALVVTLGDLVR
jgi:uncharacterized protein YacL